MDLVLGRKRTHSPSPSSSQANGESDAYQHHSHTRQSPLHGPHPPTHSPSGIPSVAMPLLRPTRSDSDSMSPDRVMPRFHLPAAEQTPRKLPDQKPARRKPKLGIKEKPPCDHYDIFFVDFHMPVMGKHTRPGRISLLCIQMDWKPRGRLLHTSISSGVGPPQRSRLPLTRRRRGPLQRRLQASRGLKHPAQARARQLHHSQAQPRQANLTASCIARESSR